jgi:UDP-glucose 4-epimerase
MKIFVTGGAGFIGSYMLDLIIKEGHEVTVYDNLSTGKIVFIEQYKNSINFVKDDIKNIEVLSKAMKGHDIVIHLAANAEVRYGASNPSVDLYEGIYGTFNVLEAMRKNDIKKIMYSSSSVVYGEAKVIPTPEDYGPLLPISIYGASKLGAEGFISAYSSTYGMNAWIYRFANIIGGRSGHGVIVDFIKKIRKDPSTLEVLGKGNQSKSYLLAEECVSAMWHIFNHANESLNVYNIGSLDQISVKEIAEAVIKEMGTPTKIVYTGTERGWPGDVISQKLSIEKLLKLNWRPKYNSYEAVLHTIKEVLKYNYI